MREPLKLLLLLLLMQAYMDDKAAQPALENELPKAANTTIDTIHYNIRGFNQGIRLGLLSDSTFYYKAEYWGCTGGGEEQFVYGIYQQESNKITLIPDRVKILGYWNEEDPFDFSSPEVTLTAYGSDSTTIKTEYYKVDAGTMSYLLSAERKGEHPGERSNTNDFEELASRLHKDNRIYGRFFSKDNKDSVTFNRAQVPERWRNLFK